MAKHLLLYSTNTWLAFKIAKEYYKDIHYAWCSPYFSVKSVPAYDYSNPPSSSPGDIYDRLFEDVTRGDLHSSRIAANRVGILKGANARAAARMINNRQKKEIYSIVEAAETLNFRPVLYIIPFSIVEKRIRIVPVSERAHPFSVEYIIDKMPRASFDVIEYRVR